MASKRGAISMEMIIVIILALITLVVVAAAFTGGMKSLIDKISGITSAIPEADRLAAKASCDQYCGAGDLDSFGTARVLVHQRRGHGCNGAAEHFGR